MSVLITGASSMIGRCVVSEYKSAGWDVVELNHSDLDLTNFNDTAEKIRYHKPEIIVHLATNSGNMYWNQKFPSETFYDTTIMGLNVLKAAIGVTNRVICVLSSCSYPNFAVCTEGQLFDGKSHDSIECHGMAKRNLEIYARQLRKQYGMKITSLIVQNSYGPYDRLELDRTKVVMALIKKFCDAKKNNTQVTVLGDGSPLRDFIYCEDVGKIIKEFTYIYENVVNVGTGNEISIRNLVEVIKEHVGYNDDVAWDVSAGSGQPRKFLDVSKLNRILLNFPFTPINVGIQKTVDWYNSIADGPVLN